MMIQLMRVYTFSLFLLVFVFLMSCTPADPAPTDSLAEDVSIDIASQVAANTDDDDACNAIETPATIVGVSVPSIDPDPIERAFWSETTALLELFVYRKSSGCASTLIESHQVDRSTLVEISESKDIADTNPIAVLNGMSISAAEYIVSLVNDPAVSNVFHICPEGFDTINEFNYIARSTDESGATVTLINGDSCGDIPGFQFSEIDGQTRSDAFSYLRDEIVSAMN